MVLNPVITNLWRNLERSIRIWCKETTFEVIIGADLVVLINLANRGSFCLPVLSSLDLTTRVQHEKILQKVLETNEGAGKLLNVETKETVIERHRLWQTWNINTWRHRQRNDTPKPYRHVLVTSCRRKLSKSKQQNAIKKNKLKEKKAENYKKTSNPSRPANQRCLIGQRL